MEKRSQPIWKMENCQRTLNLTTKEMQERNERDRDRARGREGGLESVRGRLPQFTVKRRSQRRRRAKMQNSKILSASGMRNALAAPTFSLSSAENKKKQHNTHTKK